MTATVRFWRKVASVGNSCECWIWRGARNKSGYGNFHARREAGRKVMARAHRWAYEQMVGPIGAGLFLDHLCRNRMCVNPSHLEPVTTGENTRRGIEARR